MKKILAIAVATAISAPAMADLTIGGSARYQATDTDGALATAGRVQLSVAGNATGDNGMFASYGAAVNLNMGSVADLDKATNTTESVAFDDVTLTLGNAAANVQLGEFEMYKAFSSGADTFEATNMVAATTTAAATAQVAGYENSSVRGRNVGNVQLNITSIEGVTLNVGGRLQDADTSVQVGAGTSFGDVAVAAVYESAATGSDDGMTVTAGTTLADVALNVSYGKKGTDKSTNLNASYMGFGVAFQTNEAASNKSEDKVYGSYTVEDIAGIAGADVIVGAGTAEYDNAGTKTTTDVVGVRLAYAF